MRGAKNQTMAPTEQLGLHYQVAIFGMCTTHVDNNKLIISLVLKEAGASRTICWSRCIELNNGAKSSQATRTMRLLTYEGVEVAQQLHIHTYVHGHFTC